MGRTIYFNVNKTGLLRLFRHASPHLHNFIINDNPTQSLLYHFLVKNGKTFDDLKNDAMKCADDLIVIHNDKNVFIDIFKLRKLINGADFFNILNNLITKRTKKPHIVQAATILLTSISSTQYSSEKFEQLNDKLSSFPKCTFQICSIFKESMIYWIKELSINSTTVLFNSSMPKSKIARPRNDGTDEEYDSDVSIPVFHPILEYAEISDVEDAMPEPEQDFQLPGSSRPRRKCVKIRAKKPPKKIRKVNSRSSNECFIRHESPTPFFEHVQGQYFDRLMLALPQFHYPVPAPFKTAYSRWEELPFDNKILPNYEPISYDVALEKFRSLRNGIEIPHASTLIIGDSILSSCNFEEKLDSTISIMITFPNKAIDFADAFIRKVQTNADDFSFHNVVIALGIEFICYDPDEKAIVHASREFILKLLRAFHNHFTSKPYVRFILVTVPHVQHNTRTCTYSGHIDYYNKHIRKFVFKYAEEIKEKWNIEFCLFDWEKESNLFKETTIEHVNERYQILLNEISKFTSSTD